MSCGSSLGASVSEPWEEWEPGSYTNQEKAESSPNKCKTQGVSGHSPYSKKTHRTAEKLTEQQKCPALQTASGSCSSLLVQASPSLHFLQLSSTLPEMRIMI